MESDDLMMVDKARGAMLGIMVGDALGACVEGFSPSEISAVAYEKCGGPFINKYIAAIHMGAVIPKRVEIGYRWASEVTDEHFVSSGPSSNPALVPFLRQGFHQ